ncbi:MAG: hypothetical protein HC825_10665 [Oscillatoriales cyanobacterium RM1_1_9]|nr:hypothetical protein [Oscillatoriales cyanobacterium RM1_1_9]
MKNARIKIATVFASLLFVVNLLVGGAAQALPLSTPAIPATMTDSLSDMMTEAVTSAGKNFLSSVLGEYTKTAESSFNDNFSTAKQTVNELADELERVADPNLKPADRDALLRKISDTQKSLQKIAASFNGLAENTEKFDNKLEGSVEDLLASIKGPVREQFTKMKMLSVRFLRRCRRSQPMPVRWILITWVKP